MKDSTIFFLLGRAISDYDFIITELKEKQSIKYLFYLDCHMGICMYFYRLYNDPTNTLRPNDFTFDMRPFLDQIEKNEGSLYGWTAPCSFFHHAFDENNQTIIEKGLAQEIIDKSLQPRIDWLKNQQLKLSNQLQLL